MPKRSAALLVYRRRGDSGPEVLIAHMGGPFWARKDARAWSIPKGEYDATEEPLAAARREFEEEIGSPAPGGAVAELGELRQSGGKIIVTFAVEGDLDLARLPEQYLHDGVAPGLRADPGVPRDGPGGVDESRAGRGHAGQGAGPDPRRAARAPRGLAGRAAQVCAIFSPAIPCWKAA